MSYSLMDSLNLTVSAMAIVFLLLSLIMFAIMFVGKIVSQVQDQIQEPLATEQLHELSTVKFGTVEELITNDPLAKVAALTALAKASQDEQDKRFEIVSIKKRA